MKQTKLKTLLVLAAFSLSTACAGLPNEVLTASADATGDFVYADGTHFMCNGKTFYVSGCNSYDLFTLGDGSSDYSLDAIENQYMYKSQIDERMQQMADNGVNVVRTWGFSNESWHGFEQSPGQYNEAEFMLFDYIMYSAQEHGIRVIITLENYWEAYGGIDKKLSWAGLSGGSHQNRAVYFKNDVCKQWYKDYAEHFAERRNYYTGELYKEDPTIFAWDLMNEPRYQDAGENTTGETLRAWVDEMGAFIKSVDPNHMVYAGIEGHGTRYDFGGDEGNPYVYIQQSPYIDFCSAHPYPDEYWANLSPEENAETMRQWISDAHEKVGKPFVATEFNVHSSRDSSTYEKYWRSVFDTIEEEDAAGGLFWEFNTRKLSEFTVMNGDTILSYFKQHAKNMAEKSGGSVTEHGSTNTDPDNENNNGSETVTSVDGGFSVDGTTIRDANGNAFVMRGVNIAHAWYTDKTETSIKAAARLGTNTVRIVCADGQQWNKTSASELKDIIKICRDNKQICILEVHDATGSNNASDLLRACDYWKDMKELLNENRAYVILNIANEWAGEWNGWKWADGNKQAISALRSAGIKNMIMIDSAGWGQYPASIHDYGKSVFESDPDRNTVFSIHMYEYAGRTSDMVRNNIDKSLAIGVPVVIGEFGGQHTNGDVAEETILSYCTEKKVGYLGWSWKGNNSDLAYLDIANDWEGTSLTSFGTTLFGGNGGIAQTSEICTVYTQTTKPEIIPENPVPEEQYLYPAVKTQVKEHKIGFRWTSVPGAEKYGIGVYQANKWVVKKQVDGSITTWTSPQVANGTYRLVVLAKVNGQWVNADVFKKSFYVTVK